MNWIGISLMVAGLVVLLFAERTAPPNDVATYSFDGGDGPGTEAWSSASWIRVEGKWVWIVFHYSREPTEEEASRIVYGHADPREIDPDGTFKLYPAETTGDAAP